ncbi:hypothetical protein BJ170DRAFT_716085 [Xylariales sp. AK1849]|nr:hypothetical protein BJ170DRAFT_716085 [Xylariales sp. AK1849]
MRNLAVTALSVCALSVTALQSLSDYASNIPSCAYSAFSSAAAQEGCSTTDINVSEIDCLCKHLGSIPIDVAKAVDSSCGADFASGFGGFCGTWQAESTTASDFAVATSILAAELAGETGGSGATTSSSGAATATAASAASSSTKPNVAAVATACSAVRLLGAAVAAAMIL